MRIVTYPVYELNSDLLEQHVDGHYDYCDSIGEQQRWHDLLVILETYLLVIFRWDAVKFVRLVTLFKFLITKALHIANVLYIMALVLDGGIGLPFTNRVIELLIRSFIV